MSKKGRRETTERKNTHRTLAALTSLAVVFAVAGGITTFASSGRPHDESRRASVSASLPGSALVARLATDVGSDPFLTSAIEASRTPDATPSPRAVTPSPEPVASPPAAPSQPPGPIATPAPPTTPAPAVRPTPVPRPGSSAAGLAQQLLELVNTERASLGVPQLAVHASLVAAAEDYAAFHFLNADPLQLSHDLDGAMMDRLRRHGYTGAGAEVLVAGSPDARTLLDVWLNSPQHRDILLGAQYVHIGVGCYQGPYVDPNGTRFDLALCVADLGYI